jgi:myo-inositol 2-dehydrogenase / D-chiro-inositol 1-dehydrogenase
MNKQVLNYGFIGCGMMGQEHLRNLALIGATKVTAIYEPDADMRARACRLAPEARFFETIETILCTPDIDAWVITSPNQFHANQLAQIIQNNAKPILVEKPACTNLAQVQLLRHLDERLCAPVWTAMEYRYMPAITKMIELAHAKNDTGEAVMFSIREHRYPFLTKVGDWNRFEQNTGGTLVEKCCHFFDLMRHVMQDEPIRVYASGGQNHNHLSERYDGKTPDILDNAFVVLDFARGRRAMLDLCMFAEGARYQEELCVVGPKGKIECKVPGPGRFWPTQLGDAPIAQLIVNQRHITDANGWTNQPNIKAVPPKNLQIPVDEQLLAAGDHNGSTFYQHQHFFELIKQFQTTGHHRGAQVSLTDGIKAVVIGLAAEHSAKTGLAIDLRDGPFKL